VLSLFSVSYFEKTYSLAILQPFTRKPRNKLTGFIELEQAKGKYEFCFIDSIIRPVHILPPTPINKKFSVQDLVDGDSYLRFIDMK
jgi:hypothetical protein